MARTSLKQLLTSPFLTRRLPGHAGDRVLLTFDDGPTPGVTEGVLSRLARHDVRAAFFVVGRKVAAGRSLLQEAASAGHAVGNHSFGHDDSRLPRPLAYHRDAARCSDTIAEAIGATPRLFRAPGGRLHPASLISPLRLGMRHLLWSLDSLDWQCRNDHDARQAAERVLTVVTGGDIVLLHDYDTYIHALLDTLLPGLANRGLDPAGGLDAVIHAGEGSS